MYFDSLPIWGFVGKVEKIDRSMKDHIFMFYLFTHFHFDIQYNGDRIIGIDSSADPRTVQDISYDGDKEVTFTYSAKWTLTHTKVRKRDAVCAAVRELAHGLLAAGRTPRCCTKAHVCMTRGCGQPPLFGCDARAPAAAAAGTCVARCLLCPAARRHAQCAMPAADARAPRRAV